MSLTLALNPDTNDISVGKYVYGADEVAQRVVVTLRHFYGEYFLNLPGGIPWYEVILGGKDYRISEAILRKAILSVPGVSGLLTFSMSTNHRALAIEAVIDVQGLSKFVTFSTLSLN